MPLDVPGGNSVRAALPGLRTAFAAKIFGLKPGAAISPHGRRNMVSMHTVLRGNVRVRHFDRLRADTSCSGPRWTGSPRREK